MDGNTNYKTGIDKAGTEFLTACVETSESSKRILFLKKISQDELIQMLSLGQNPFFMSVSDKAVLGKYLVVGSGQTDSDKLVQFELKNSLLDEPSEFCYDIVPTSDSSRQLAMLIRKTKLNEIQNSIATEDNTALTPAGFAARSVALGKGFLEFCSNDTERLACLADFSTESVSLCFVLGSSIVAPASFDQSQFDWHTELDQSRVTAELRTIINFKLNELAAKGINISLSKLIICGGKLTFNQKQAIASKLSVQLEAPRFKDNLLNNVQLPSDSTWADYLVSLGLTIE